MEVARSLVSRVVDTAKQHPKKSALASAVFLHYFYKNFLKHRKRVRDKVILITGAGSGIGKNMACRLAALGAKVVLWDINGNAINSVALSITQSGSGRAWTYVVDVRNRESVMQTAERVAEDVGTVDILINNAGIVSGNWITDIKPENVRRTFEVNVLAHFWTIQAFLPAMLNRNKGHIVTIASAAGLSGAPKLTDYCASKFATVGLDESLRVELKRRGATGVKTTCICPFYINTGMFDGVNSKFPLLLPILGEDYASASIIDAIRTNEPWMAMPRIVYIGSLLKFLLPVGVLDTVGDFLGIHESMDDFKGRHSAAVADDEED